MTKIFLHQYKAGSQSAKLLADESGFIKRIKLKNSKFKPRANKIVINWGCSNLPDYAPCQIVNKPEAVALTANKLKFFQFLEEKDVRLPDYTTDRDIALEWLLGGAAVVCRTILNGNSGAGIVLVEPGEGEEALVDAPLYTKYVPKKQEYRIHVFNGEVLDIQRKARKQEVADEDVNWKIRNHDNGFIFAREGFETPDDVIEQSVACVKELGLDFGAVDVIYNDRREEAYVLEVNTAPGLTGTTLANYIAKFEEMLV